MQKSRLAIVVSTPRGRLLCLALLAGSALTGPLAHAAPMAGRGGLIGGLPTQFAGPAGAAAQLTPGLYEPVGAALGGPGLIARPIAVVAAPSSAVAVVLPTGGTVMAGAASIGAASGGTLSVSQSSAKAIIDWGSFSIGSGGTVSFQNGSGATLNRVTGASVSAIDGLLSATGSVYLINPNGVIVGKTGVVNVGGSFVASTLDVDNAAFLGGGPLTFAGPSTASVVNLGKVGALGGDVALIATTVSNAGQVSAANGSAGLLSGSSVVMTDASLDGGRFAVALPAAGGGVTNSGAIAAATAELRANGGDVYALAGDTAGVIRATGVSAGGGKIWLVAEGGTAKVAGTLEAQGANGAAGAIETSGDQVLVGAAAIDAHGGTWTLDPINLTIDTTAATTISNALATSDVVEQTTATAASGTGNQASGAGDIILASGASISWSSAKALTLSAYHDVNLLGTISDSGTGVLTLRADNAGTGSGTVKLTGTNGQVTLGSGAAANIFYNPTSYTDTATQSIQMGVAIPQVEIYTNPYSNPYAGSNQGQQQAANAPVQGGTVRAYMLVNSLAQLGGASTGGLTGVGAQLNGVYALNADIDASSTKTANAVTGMTGTYFGFTPIGYSSGNTTNSFTGLFDGQGHTISNLYINHFTLDSNNNKQNTDATGLFGFVTGGDAAATFVRNLNVLNATVIGSGAQSGIIAGGFQANAVGSNLVTSGTVSGYRVGGVTGQLYSNGAIKNSSSSAVITSGGDSGGLVGENYGGSISGSFATGSVTGGSNIGGLVGGGGSAVTNSYATGNVSGSDTVGGLAGQLGSSSNVYATGTVTATSGGTAGGLAGFQGRGTTLTNAFATGAVSAKGDNVGGLIGGADGDVTITGSYATGAVTTTGNNVGGLVGLMQPSSAQNAARPNISNSFATGAVTSTAGGGVGGLLGSIFAVNITSSYASGAVKGATDGVGGLIGAVTDYGDYGTGFNLADSYATGSVTLTGPASNAANAFIGGLIGSERHEEPTTGATLTVIRSYATGAVSGNAVSGGLIGRNAGVITNDIWDRTSTGQANGVGATQTSFTTNNPATISVTNLTSVQDTTASAADYAFSAMPYTNAGFLFGVTPGGNTSTANGRVVETWVQIDSNGTLNAANGAAIETRPFLLMEYATNVINAHQLELINLAKAAKYTLGADINAAGTATTADMWAPGGFAPIGTVGSGLSFTGSLDGQGRTISGLTINLPSLVEVGLFGDVGYNQAVTNSTITNLTLSNASVTGGSSAVGILAGNALATISNIVSSGSATGQTVGGLVGISSQGSITNSASSATVTGVAGGNQNLTAAAGGLVGYVLGTGSATSGVFSSSATGAVSGVGNVGGLVGYANGSVASGPAFLTNDIATGKVTGTGDSVGGLVGQLALAFLTDSYATGGVSGATRVGGLVGYSNGFVLTDVQIKGSAAGKTFASGAVTGTGPSVGGLVGQNAAGLTLASATGAVTSGSSANTAVAIGGLIGTNSGAVSGASAGGAVTDKNTALALNGGTGGLIGVNSGTVTGSTASGAVTAAADGDVGGFIGLDTSTGGISGVTVANAVVGYAQVGGLVGATSAPIVNSAATGPVTGTLLVGGLVGATDNNISASAASGVVTGVGGSTQLGGLAGLIGHIFTGSGAAIAVNGTNVSFTGGVYGPSAVNGSAASGKVSGQTYAGGLVGFAAAQTTISGSSASGTVQAMVDPNTSGSGNIAGGLVGGLAGAAVSNSYATGAVSGASNVGGLVGGEGYGQITTGGTVYGSSITGSYAKGVVTATVSDAGGLVGFDVGQSITDSYATGNVSGGTLTGGLVGFAQVLTFQGQTTAPSITGSAAGKTYATGSVTGTGAGTGGLVGQNQGTITVASYGPIGSGVSGTSYVGGLVGYNDTGSKITNGSSSGAVTGTAYVGGAVGDNFGALSAVSESGAVNGAAGTGGLIGVNEGGGTVNVAAVSGNVTGTGNDVGGIAGANFGTLAKVGVSGSKVTGIDHTGGLVGYNAGSVTGAADGSVSGRDYTGGQIGLNYSALALSGAGTGLQTAPSGLEVVNGRTYVGGLIGWNDASGTASGAVALATTAATGDYVGGVAGVNKGTLTGVRSAGGAASGARYVGGLVGLNQGAISGSSASVPAVGNLYVGGLVGWNDTGATITKSYATGAVTGRVSGAEAGTNNDYVGGLIGVNFGAASDVYATGAVSGVQVVGGLVGTNMPGGAAITRAYSTGAVTATLGAVGGLAGVQAGTLTNTYFQPSASGQTSGAGYTTANASGAATAIGPGTNYDANAQATYQGFDFTNTWQVNTGSPPTLKGVTQ